MGKKLYLECYSGISGDMTVAALLDLGVDEKILLEALDSIPIEGFRCEIKRVKKSDIEMCDFKVILDKKHKNYDHDMKYLHEEVGEVLKDTHIHKHEHRNLKDIKEIINHSKITNKAKEISINIFNIIADSEAKAHDTDINNVHFHEVGAVDSIVDIVAVAVCLDNLNIEETIVSTLYEGYGTIRCQHGILPIPVPAVTNIVEKYKLDIRIIKCKGELITPTGAAIVAAIKSDSKLPKTFSIAKVGMGAGKRKYDSPGFLRAMIIEDNSIRKSDIIYKLESNIDDCSGENLGLVMEKLMENGAKDVHFTPVFMKKNRPGYILNIICIEKDVEKLENIIFRETTTIGIRKCLMERSVLERKIEVINTTYGKIRIKVCNLGDEIRGYPEYEDIRRITKEYGISYQNAYHDILSQYNSIR